MFEEKKITSKTITATLVQVLLILHLTPLHSQMVPIEHQIQNSPLKMQGLTQVLILISLKIIQALEEKGVRVEFNQRQVQQTLGKVKIFKVILLLVLIQGIIAMVALPH